ncbi:hypothetical protein ACN38_g12184 [Penicillium nordicum]|uniref:Nudix hydrolase domain-containing protein n=1 Tax=Penicillium nordicum TaxID=229535 RepID=A0A0M9WA29_9EURO|nr:hypothetical protein ACN38_g12184 [Penicillium nordicum]
MGFSTVPVEEIDIPLDDFQAKQPDIAGFSASALIFCYYPQLRTFCLLLCLRAPLGKDENGKDKPNSWAFTWEPPGGACEKTDQTILTAAKRETKEEVNLRSWCVSRKVYRDSWTHKGIPMARYTVPMDVCEPIQPQRIWCDKQQEPVGIHEGPIQLREDEHLDYCWATEAQIRDSPPYDEKNPRRRQRGLVMLESKKEIIFDAFKQLKNSQLDMTYGLW